MTAPQVHVIAREVAEPVDLDAFLDAYARVILAELAQQRQAA